MHEKPKTLYSQIDYTSVILLYFTGIRPTEHYLNEHRSVPWGKVVELILTTKNPRKKGSKFEIESDGYYVLFEIKDNVLKVINAKKG